jgi:hypothetical protein
MESKHKTNGKCYGINHKIMVAYPNQKNRKIKKWTTYISASKFGILLENSLVDWANKPSI